MEVNKILITGSTGFVGNAVLSSLSLSNTLLIAPVRQKITVVPNNVVMPVFADISELHNIPKLLDASKVVIHMAAKAHVVGEPLAAFTRINTEATLRFAQHCAEMGVARFIFLSSIGVNGITSVEPFNVSDAPHPVENYAISKLKAEIGLKKIADESGMELVIIRPPLVYGRWAPGNFGRLLQFARVNLPLPLGAIKNKRSLVAIDNLVDLIITCIDHPKAANQTFLVSDDHDVSTTELLKMMTRAAGKKPMLLPIYPSWLRLIGTLVGKQALIDRLCGNLQVDISHTKNTLGWKPPITVEEGIRRCFFEEE